jgi:cardiolipin synthase
MPTGPNHPTEPLLHLVVEAIHASRRNVIITSPYMVPDEASMLALCLAAKRGVQVDLVVPKRGDHPLVRAASRAYFEDLLEAGVHIHLHTLGLLHAKTITIDDTVSMIGSANFDIRSFFLNFELNVLLYGPHVNARLRFFQRHYISESEPLQLSEWRKRSATAQFIDDMMKLLSPLL